MRWFYKEYPAHFECRVKSWFAFTPVNIGLETRWLEVVKVRQRYQSASVAQIVDRSYTGWKNLNFEND